MAFLRAVFHGRTAICFIRAFIGLVLLCLLCASILQSSVTMGTNGNPPSSTLNFRPRRQNPRGKSFLIGKTYKNDTLINIEGEWSKEKERAQKEIFQKRFLTLKTKCLDLGDERLALRPNISEVYANLRWVTEHNLVWCPVYKAASTTWMINLLSLAGETEINTGLHKRVRQIYGPPNNEILRGEVLQKSLKMLIVRHPLERLLSAYRDKFLREVSRENMFSRLSAKIRSVYADPNQEDASNNLTSPTFTQFLLRVRRDMRRFWKKGGEMQVNNHWKPIWWSCAPCQILYDTIAHVETLAFDQEYVIRQTKLENKLHNAHTHASNFDTYNSTSEASKHYFSQVPKSLLADVTELYRPDFDLFGYTYKDYIAMGK